MTSPIRRSLPVPKVPLRRPGRPPTAGLREVILAAAARVFTEREFHEVKMDDLARASGVGKGTLYRYFPGKRELYLALVFDGLDRLHAEVERELEGPGPPVRKVERIVRCILALFWERQLFFTLLHRGESRSQGADAEEWARRRTGLARLLAQALDEGVAAGQVRPLDMRLAAEMLLGMLRAVNRYRSPQDRLEAVVRAVVETFLCGVATPAGRRSALAVSPGRRP
jgi:TetR/AcrR family fatty acid metabolism transcriptional regulator